MHYITCWLNILNGNKFSSAVSTEEDSCVIEDLDACVEYEVSVIAVNKEDNSINAVTCKMTTATAVNYPVQITFYIYYTDMD